MTEDQSDAFEEPETELEALRRMTFAIESMAADMFEIRQQITELNTGMGMLLEGPGVDSANGRIEEVKSLLSCMLQVLEKRS